MKRLQGRQLELVCSASKDCCRCTWPWDPGELLPKCEAVFWFCEVHRHRAFGNYNDARCMYVTWMNSSSLKKKNQKSAPHRSCLQVIHNLGYQGCYPLRLGLPGTLQLGGSFRCFKVWSGHVVGTWVVRCCQSCQKAIRQFCAAGSSLRSLGRFALPVSFTWTNFLWRHRRDSEPHQGSTHDTSWQLKVDTHTLWKAVTRAPSSAATESSLCQELRTVSSCVKFWTKTVWNLIYLQVSYLCRWDPNARGSWDAGSGNPAVNGRRQGGFRLHDFATAPSRHRCVIDVSQMPPQCVTGCHSEVAGKSYFLVGILNGQGLRQV